MATRTGPAGLRDSAAAPEDFGARVTAALRGPAAQQPSWPDPERARAVRERLRQAPPVVQAGDIDRLRDRLSLVARGEAFLLQSGSCAERFADITRTRLRSDVALLRHLAALLAGTSGMPVVNVARIAGQFGKPRSSALDVLGLPAYRGDIVNSGEPDPAARVPDPGRMLRAHSAAMTAMTAIRAAGAGDTEIFASHEALILDYERSLLRVVRTPAPARLYGQSAHFLWIGERTRQLDGAHLALAELISNPLGVKIGPATTPEQAAEYVRRLDPGFQAGRLTFICRMGSGRVRDVLPPIVERVTAMGNPVIWVCDPMHGNTRESPTGYKTRHLDDIAGEIRGFFEVHHRLGTWPGGIHLETASEDVTECLGGRQGLSEADLPRRYETACDPRLNARQAAEITTLAGEMTSMTPARRRS
jgi:3-deoxy-D-arabino-heptulosonate 7-phosphate (DAHP) synthase class II